MRMIFAIDEAADLLLETGFKKPLTQLELSDKQRVQSLLLNYHCILKVKGEMDQFREGLESLGVMKALSRNASLLKLFFVSPRKTLTAG